MIAVSRASPSSPPASARSSSAACALDGAHEAAIEGVIGAFEDDGRLAEPRDQSARHDARIARARDRRTAAARVEIKPVLDQRARVGARQRVSAARRCRSQPKPCSASLQAADGGATEGRVAVRVADLSGATRNGRHRCRRRRSDRRCGCPAARSAAGSARPPRKAETPARDRQRTAQTREPARARMRQKPISAESPVGRSNPPQPFERAAARIARRVRRTRQSAADRALT